MSLRLNPFRLGHLAVVLVCLLGAGLALTATKMLDYRSRLHDLTDNGRWERTLRANDLYRDKTIVFFGDSQIALWPMAPSFGVLPIVNRGKSGDWASRAVQRFDEDVIGIRPRYLVMLIGTNDLGNGQSVESIIKSIEAMVRKARDHDIDVLLCSILPVRNEYLKNHPTRDIVSVNAKLAALVQEHGAEYVDLYSALADADGTLSPNFTSDGLHPNRTGFLRMATVLYPRLMNKIVHSFQAS